MKFILKNLKLDEIVDDRVIITIILITFPFRKPLKDSRLKKGL